MLKEKWPRSLKRRLGHAAHRQASCRSRLLDQRRAAIFNQHGRNGPWMSSSSTWLNQCFPDPPGHPFLFVYWRLASGATSAALPHSPAGCSVDAAVLLCRWPTRGGRVSSRQPLLRCAASPPTTLHEHLCPMRRRKHLSDMQMVPRPLISVPPLLSDSRLGPAWMLSNCYSRGLALASLSILAGCTQGAGSSCLQAPRTPATEGRTTRSSTGAAAPSSLPEPGAKLAAPDASGKAPTTPRTPSSRRSTAGAALCSLRYLSECSMLHALAKALR